MDAEILIDWSSREPNWEKPLTFKLQNEIHIWRVNVGQVLNWVKGKIYLLDENERNKLERLHRFQDKNRFLVSRVLRKILLANYLETDPEDIEFEETQNYKPYLKGREKFHFNTSHSGNWVLFAFSSESCGIDIEKIKPDFNYSNVMKNAFHHSEAIVVKESEDPMAVFFRIWAIKESILKATGIGLIDNLPDLVVLEGENPLPTILDSKSKYWYNISFSVENNYWCSLTFQKPDQKVRFFDF